MIRLYWLKHLTHRAPSLNTMRLLHSVVQKRTFWTQKVGIPEINGLFKLHFKFWIPFILSVQGYYSTVVRNKEYLRKQGKDQIQDPSLLIVWPLTSFLISLQAEQTVMAPTYLTVTIGVASMTIWKKYLAWWLAYIKKPKNKSCFFYCIHVVKEAEKGVRWQLLV